MRQRGARARQPVVVQAAEVDALLEVDLRVAGRLQRPLPVVVRVDVVGPDDLRLGQLVFFAIRIPLLVAATADRRVERRAYSAKRTRSTV